MRYVTVQSITFPSGQSQSNVCAHLLVLSFSPQRSGPQYLFLHVKCPALLQQNVALLHKAIAQHFEALRCLCLKRAQ